MSIFLACVLTIVLETAFFLLLRYRSKPFLTLCVCANAATNLSLNLLLYLAAVLGFYVPWMVYPLEVLVVAAEYLLYAALLGRGWKLFALTLAANLLSYGVGLLAF